jgi:hypothetical protein
MSTEHICKDCKSVLGVRHATEAWESWKCVHPNNIKQVATNPVNGNPVRHYNAEHILECRVDLCKGDWFEEYVKPDYKEFTITEQHLPRPAAKKSLKSIGMDDL